MNLQGTIRRWTHGFGFVNYYDTKGELERFFVHPKNVKPGSAFTLEFGVRIQFTPGEPRHPGECRSALEIEPLITEENAEAGLEKLAIADNDGITEVLLEKLVMAENDAKKGSAEGAK